MMERTAATSAALADELRNVLHQAQELIHAIGDDRDAALTAVRDRVNTAMDSAKERLAELEQQAGQASRRAAVATEAYVREHPWTAVSIGAALGLVVGSMLAANGRAPSEEDE